MVSESMCKAQKKYYEKNKEKLNNASSERAKKRYNSNPDVRARKLVAMKLYRDSKKINN